MSKLSLSEDLSKLSLTIYEIADKKFPHDELYNTTAQMKSAMISARLNVREGNTFFDLRKNTHFERALGSLCEVDECMIIALEMKWITQDTFDHYRLVYWECFNKLKKLIQSIKLKVKE